MDFSRSRPPGHSYTPDFFSFVDANGLRYAWHAYFYADLEVKTKRVFPAVTDDDIKECSEKLIDYITLHIPTIIERICSKNLWNQEWNAALGDQNGARFIAWLFKKSNPLRVHGNDAAHVMKRDGVVRALRESAKDRDISPEDRFCIRLVGNLVSTGTFEQQPEDDEGGDDDDD